MRHDLNFAVSFARWLFRLQFHTPGANIESVKERIRGYEERIILLKEIKKDGDARLAVSASQQRPGQGGPARKLGKDGQCCANS